MKCIGLENPFIPIYNLAREQSIKPGLEDSQVGVVEPDVSLILLLAAAGQDLRLNIHTLLTTTTIYSREINPPALHIISGAECKCRARKTI